MTVTEERALLGARIRNRREYCGFTQAEVADYLGIPRPAITHIEKGARGIDASEVKGLAKLFGCSVASLLAEEDDERGTTGIGMVARATADLSDEDRAEVMRFAEFLRSRRRGSEGNHGP